MHWPTPLDHALLKAAHKGDLPALRAALDAGAHPDASRALGPTPLTLMAERGSAQGVAMLIERGAGVEIKLHPEGTTALALTLNLECARLLLAAGANPNALDSEGSHPLMGKPPEISRALIQAGAWVNASDREGRTALMIAAGSGKAQTLAALLDEGALVGLRDKLGQTALSFAAQGRVAILGSASSEELRECARLLLRAGASPHSRSAHPFETYKAPLSTIKGASQKPGRTITPERLARLFNNTAVAELIERHAKGLRALRQQKALRAATKPSGQPSPEAPSAPRI